MKNISSLITSELSKRDNIPNILDYVVDFPKSYAFVTDKSKRIAVCGTRRAQKSTNIAILLINQAIKFPNSSCLYAGLTFASAERIMYKDILVPIFDRFHISVQYNMSKKELHFDNNSIIYLYGLDSTPHQAAKLRGQKFSIASIDEIQDFDTTKLNEIIEGVLSMSLAQTNAQLILGGTPGSTIGEHLWKDINLNRKDFSYWELHNLDWKDNTAIEPSTGLRICDAIQADIDEQINKNPLIVNTNAFKREVLGEWVLDETKLVYKYNPNLNNTNNISITNTKIGDKEWVFILGVDFGYEHPSTLCTIAYHPFDPNTYVLESEGHSHWSLTELADRIHQLHSRYHYSHMIADSASPQSIEEINRHHHLFLKPAHKLGKEGHIALQNADFITSNIKIYPATNTALIKELQTLVWDDKHLLNGKFVEKITTSGNDYCDALHYAYYFARHYNAVKEPIKTPMNEPSNEDIFNMLKSAGYVGKIAASSYKGKSMFDNPSNAEILEAFRKTTTGVPVRRK